MKKNPLVYSFFIIIFGIFIVDILNKDKIFSELENRKLKTKVKFSWREYYNGDFSKKYEEYVNDQFILRDNWINIKSRSEYLLGKIENNNIIYGKDGFLFDKVTRFDEKRVDTNINAINELVNSIDTRVSVILVPNSSEIYKEKLPVESPVINQEEEIDIIYNKLKNCNKINLINTMKENKDKYIYYKTDHHWTSYGAYLAYKEYINFLMESPVKLEKFNEVKLDNFYGTYFSKAKPFNSLGDKLTFYEIDNLTMSVGENNYDGIYDYSKVNIRDKYSIFLRGNNPLSIIRNKGLSNGKRILIFKDSYANSLVPFLTQNFEEIHVVDLRSFGVKVSDYIKDNTFDEVLILYNFTSFIRDTDIIKLKL
ncbi:hypothetical protein JCM1393_02400 [Clostridium carnis]